MRLVLIVPPGDFDLPDLKAKAAEDGYDVVVSRYCPPGTMLVCHPSQLWLDRDEDG